MPGKVILTFRSTHDAIVAERLCLRNKIACQAIPVPRDISAECGIALETSSTLGAQMISVLEGERIPFVVHER